MVDHSSLISECLKFGERALLRLDQSKTFLLTAAQLHGLDQRKLDSIVREARAMALVSICAELEALVRGLITATHAEFNATGLSIADLKPSLRSLIAHSTFESLRNINDATKSWPKRAYATTLEMCADQADFPIMLKAPQPPLDGRTLRPEHFARLWEIYSLPGSPFPTVSSTITLTKVAGVRNDIAHGNLNFEDIFKQPGLSAKDVEGYIDDASQIVIHLVVTWEDYLDNAGYKV